MQKIMKELQREIIERTIGLEQDDFVSFLRELAEWATFKADESEYMPEAIKEMFNEE